jgi:predicted type IV restriction endonuclease
MHQLNFPQHFDFDIRDTEGKDYIFDPLRRKYVRLTPEEWVRQHLIQYLTQDLGFPAGRTAIESGFSHQGILHRADLIVHNRQGKPVLMAECKAPEVKLNQNAFDQIARYNTSVQADCLVVTNGLTHYCYVLDRGEKTYRFLEQLPKYEEL